ncbi:hypothetical protein IWW36_000028 [Coemansia brasiliensis]|uniref:Uncharacterized protein n=1 Tax=Coemansia brasiliensis TaxID=2650707 RepID=A0A9W8M1M5_9FUNG|nr:hypothetical protein IWW36_000028 [Coemansia brasiliensis]
MTLFGDLPPPKESENAQNDAQEPLSDAEKISSNARSWSRPELVPNLRRPKSTSKSRTSTTSTKPKDALALVSRWEEAASTAEEPSSSQPSLPKRLFLNSLAEYLPVSSKKNSNVKNKRPFDPHAAYNPAVPNSYQAYKQWLESQKDNGLLRD